MMRDSTTGAIGSANRQPGKSPGIYGAQMRTGHRAARSAKCLPSESNEGSTCDERRDPAPLPLLVDPGRRLGYLRHRVRRVLLRGERLRELLVLLAAPWVHGLPTIPCPRAARLGLLRQETKPDAWLCRKQDRRSLRRAGGRKLCEKIHGSACGYAGGGVEAGRCHSMTREDMLDVLQDAEQSLTHAKAHSGVIRDVRAAIAWLEDEKNKSRYGWCLPDGC